jgi:uncharacterized protein
VDAFTFSLLFWASG